MTDKLQATLSTSYKPMRITSMDEREVVMDFRYAKIAPSAMIAAQMRRISGRAASSTGADIESELCVAARSNEKIAALRRTGTLA